MIILGGFILTQIEVIQNIGGNKYRFKLRKLKFYCNFRRLKCVTMNSLNSF